MPTIILKDGLCTHNCSGRMVTLATKWLLEYFADNVARMSGDLEDDFAGQWSLDLKPFRSTPFFPALALLVLSGEVVHETDAEGRVWYAAPGALPSQANPRQITDGS